MRQENINQQMSAACNCLPACTSLTFEAEIYQGPQPEDLKAHRGQTFDFGYSLMRLSASENQRVRSSVC
jgi:hypothetical protein